VRVLSTEQDRNDAVKEHNDAPEEEVHAINDSWDHIESFSLVFQFDDFNNEKPVVNTEKKV